MLCSFWSYQWNCSPRRMVGGLFQTLMLWKKPGLHKNKQANKTTNNKEFSNVVGKLGQVLKPLSGRWDQIVFLFRIVFGVCYCFIVMCICILPACLSVWGRLVPWTWGVTDSCEPPCGYWLLFKHWAISLAPFFFSELLNSESCEWMFVWFD